MAKVFGAYKTCVYCLLFVFVCNISNNFVQANFQEIEKYEVFSSLPSLNVNEQNGMKFREKRQAVSDSNTKYQTQNNTGSGNGSNSSVDSTAPSTVVNYDENTHRRLLGENGTGQRRYPLDNNTTQQPMVIAAEHMAAPAEGRKLGTSQVLGVAETSIEQVADRVDVPENETINELEHQGYNVNQTTDYHNYYNSTIYVNKMEANQIWQDIHNSTYNSMLSQAHRRAMTVELKFDFPFYGHAVRNITVATGGFLYTGEYVHSWLAATQYIAPLMANFDTSISNDSFVRLNDNGTAMTVLWENVSLQDKPDVGKFTFSTTLHSNGDIVFTYFNVPIVVNSIQDDKHPVKVGLSDAYIIDKVIFLARRKTIFEYHRVNFNNVQISNSTIIRLVALPTCLNYTDCVSCIEHHTSFDCGWCPVMNRCSSGTDRRKQEWIQRGCDRLQISDSSACPALGSKGNNAANINGTGSQYLPNANGNPKNNYNIHDQDKSSFEHMNEEHSHANDDAYHSILEPSNPLVSISNSAPGSASKAASVASSNVYSEHAEKHKSVGVAMGIIVPIALVSFLLAWVVYAYRHPHTKSGQLLIQYRPSTWSWRRGEARYTAATIHM